MQYQSRRWCASIHRHLHLQGDAESANQLKGKFAKQAKVAKEKPVTTEPAKWSAAHFKALHSRMSEPRLPDPVPAGGGGQHEEKAATTHGKVPHARMSEPQLLEPEPAGVQQEEKAANKTKT